MSTTLKRTSMALDQESLDTLEELSAAWATSKAEVLRRSLKLAKDKHQEETPALSPQDALRWLQKNGITHDQAEEWKKELKAERMAWPDRWADDEASRHQHSD